MLANREGAFNALPAEFGVDRTGDNHLLTVTIRFDLVEEWGANGWMDIRNQALETIAYLYLEKKDGSINEIALKQLRTAFGWDGMDPWWLQESDLSNVCVQLRLANETYKGKTSARVKYLNPWSEKPATGVSRGSDETRQEVMNSLGPKFRAFAGANAAPKPPAGSRPTPPRAPKPQPTPPPVMEPEAPINTSIDTVPIDDLPPDVPSDIIADDGRPVPPNGQPADIQWAWGQFPHGKMAKEQVKEEWKRIIAEMFPGMRQNDFSADDWLKLGQDGPSMVIPI